MRMKSKSKLNKTKEKKQGNQTGKGLQSVSGEWLYFAGGETTVRKIGEVLEGQAYELEIWEDAGVLEVGMEEGMTIDFEQTQIHPKDEVTAAFARENQCETVFLVTFAPECYESAENVMKKILAQNGGLFCADNAELQPVLR